jgi:hypothetical protein
MISLCVLFRRHIGEHLRGVTLAGDGLHLDVGVCLGGGLDEDLVGDRAEVDEILRSTARDVLSVRVEIGERADDDQSRAGQTRQPRRLAHGACGTLRPVVADNKGVSTLARPPACHVTLSVFEREVLQRLLTVDR